MSMNDEQFWQLIETSRQAGSSEQGAALRSLLSALTVDDIVEFQNIFDRMTDQANTGDVYGAGSLIRGRQLSDSTSAYFRNWLVAQGRAAHQSALRDPETLAEIEIHEDPWDEDVAYAAIDAFGAKSGDDFYARLSPPEFRDPDFDWSIYDSTYLERHFPKLWAKYGAHFKD